MRSAAPHKVSRKSLWSRRRGVFRRSDRKAAVMGFALVALGGFGLFAAAPHPPRPPQRARDLAALEAYLGQLVDSGDPPGLSVVVVRDGRIAYERALGFADKPRGQRASDATRYHWWSMTKIPTAMAVLQLVEQARLHLDAPVTDYLPWFEVDYPSTRSPRVTVRHLLNHSSGLPDTMPAMIGWVHYDDAARDQTALTERYLRDFKRLRFEPGSDSRYSNFNYMVLGALIEVVSGQSYEAYVVANVLRPLGINETSFLYPSERSADEAAGSLPVVHFYTPMLPFLLDARALIRERQGRLLWFRPMYLDVTPSSGLIGPAHDVARLMLAYLQGGQLDGSRVLRPETVELMTSTSRVGDHGLGWFVGSADGRRYLQHPGGGPGFATVMRVYPEEGLGTVVMANGTDLDYDGISDLLASLDW
jgi:CubicO group peptidase (beta-lactamase class C family)